MAEFDLPATVDKVLAETKQEQIFYVGHSQGTTIGFIKFSEDLEFAKKIKVFFALAPVAWIEGTTSPVKYIAPFTPEIYEASKIVGFDTTGDLDWIKKFVEPICEAVDKRLCDSVLFWLVGATNTNNINETRIPIYISHSAAGTSMKDIAHYGQLCESGYFRKFDYGFIGNLERYHRLSPPSFPVEKMAVDTELFWSFADALADPSDVDRLMPKIQHKHQKEVDGYSHIDFLYAMSATKLIYEPIIRVMKNGFVPDN